MDYFFQVLDCIRNKISKVSQKFQELTNYERLLILTLVILHVIQILLMYLASVFSFYPFAAFASVLIGFIGFVFLNRGIDLIIYYEYFLLVIMFFPLLTTRMVWIITLASKLFSWLSDLKVGVHNCSSYEMNTSYLYEGIINSWPLLISQGIFGIFFYLARHFKFMEKEKPSVSK
ncbi:hypothetical protein Avbf_02402 [Armadillidium vulgare]|nr:hypothetical protein Avbf_02402 [Armadillidium vulgare]